jgi:hypothetical protein
LRNLKNFLYPTDTHHGSIKQLDNFYANLTIDNAAQIYHDLITLKKNMSIYESKLFAEELMYYSIRGMIIWVFIIVFFIFRPPIVCVNKYSTPILWCLFIGLFIFGYGIICSLIIN